MLKVLLILMALATGASFLTEKMCTSPADTGVYKPAICVGQRLVHRSPGSCNVHPYPALPYYHNGDFKIRLVHTRKVNHLPRTLEELAVSHNCIGLAHYMPDQQDLTLMCFSRYLPLTRQIKSLGKSTALSHSPSVHHKKGELAEAFECHRMGLNPVTDSEVRSKALMNIGIV